MAENIISFNQVEKDGSVKRCNFRSVARAIDIDRTNPKLPPNVSNLQSLVDALGKLAFDDSIITYTPPLPVTNFSAKSKDTAIELTWEDPDDRIVEGETIEWQSTRIVRKTGSYPSSETDGVVVTESYVKNQYLEEPFIDEGLVNGVKYYYRAFSYATNGNINKIDEVQVLGTPKGLPTMTVHLDLTDSNPKTCGSYRNDAKGMPDGKTTNAIEAWKDYFGYRPCLFKDGQVVGYLNPNDYTKFENGAPADITSGDAGDVMIEFPRRGLSYECMDGYDIHMTEKADSRDYDYYAFTRGSESVDKFYIGAYPGHIDSLGRLRSISGVSPIKTSLKRSAMREAAHKNGERYETMTWWQYAYILSCYCLQFRGKLDSQSEIGYGIDDYDPSTYITGACDKSGLFYGSTSSNDHVKLFGIEDLYGSASEYIDGICGEFDQYSQIDRVYVGTTNFNDQHSGYDMHEFAPSLQCVGYLVRPYGSHELAMLPKITGGGSTSTYFCDSVYYLNDFDTVLIGRGMIESSFKDYGLFSTYSMSLSSSASDRICRLSYY